MGTRIEPRARRRCAALALALFGAGAAGVAGGRAASGPDARRIDSNDGAYVVEYELEPAEVPLNEEFALTARVLAAGDEGRPASGIELSVDARMPQHRHGMRRDALVTALPDGRFRVEGLRFHMPGYWELYFDVTRGAVTERAQDGLELE